MLSTQANNFQSSLYKESDLNSKLLVNTVIQMSIRQRLKDFLTYMKLSEGAFEKKVDVSKGYVSNVKGGIGSTTLLKISKHFPELNTKWLINGEGPMIWSGSNELNEQEIKPIVKSGQDIFDAGLLNYPYTLKGDLSKSESIDIGDGRYLLVMRLVSEYAYASYPGGFKDPEYIETLEKHSIVVDKRHAGNYRAFEIVGDSMENYTTPEMAKQSIPWGSIVIGREIQRPLWQYRLHTNKWTEFVLVHKTEGITCKQITAHDTDTGMLTLHPLNPLEKDFEWNMDDIQEIYNVVKVTTDR